MLKGYPAGEMKHGPIHCFSWPRIIYNCINATKFTIYDKIKSNVEELSARDSTICAISPLDFDLADDFVKINQCDHYMLEFLKCVNSFTTFINGNFNKTWNDVDMPRNLSKISNGWIMKKYLSYILLILYVIYFI